MIPGSYHPAVPAVPAATVPAVPAVPAPAGTPATPAADSGQWMNWLQQALGGNAGQFGGGDWLRQLKKRRQDRLASFGGTYYEGMQPRQPSGPRPARQPVQGFAPGAGLDWLSNRLRDARSTLDA